MHFTPHLVSPLWRAKVFVALALFCAGAFAQPAAPVSVDAVVRQAFSQSVPIIGRLVAQQSGAVAARIGGSVAQVLVQPGDRVRAGQTLARIDAAELQLRRQQADARLTTAQAELALTSQEVKRLSDLQDSAAASRASLDDALQRQNVARARVNEADADAKLAALNLQHAEIVAPYAGVVIEKLTEVGSYAQPGQAVATLIADAQLELEIDAPVARLAGLLPGTEVEFTLQDRARRRAVVRAIIPRENPNTRTRRVRFRIDLPDAGEAFAAEQSATVFVPAGAAREILSVHKDALIRRGGGAIAFVVANGVAEVRPVQTGAASGARIEVLDGLAEGDLSVVRGNERLQPGQPVQIAE